jgi:hypothetical protein
VRRARAAVTAAAMILVTGCGASDVPSAADQVPALSMRLDRIDSALAGHRFPAARTALKALIADTRRAARAGDLSEATAAQIIAAAQRLLAALPSAPAVVETTAPESPDSGSSAKPSSRPTVAEPSSSPTPEVPVPASSPTESTTQNPTPSPTSDPSREASPTASPSAADAGPVG